MATDEQALNRIQKQLNIIGLDIFNPRKKGQEEILNIIAQPDN